MDVGISQRDNPCDARTVAGSSPRYRFSDVGRRDVHRDGAKGRSTHREEWTERRKLWGRAQGEREGESVTRPWRR